MAIKIDPNNAFTPFNIGLALCSLGKYDEAIDNFKNAIKLNPKEAYIHNSLGLALISIGKYDEAI